MNDKYVSDMNPAELRAHMRRLKAMDGWHEPLADALFEEIQRMDAAAPSASAQQAEPYNAYQRDWDKVVRWVKVQSETFPELANMSPEGAISWLVVELAARHEKFAEPSASPAAMGLTCPQCRMPKTKNPHPDAGKPDLTVGYLYECIPCLVKTRTSWAQRALAAEKRIRELEAPAGGERKKYIARAVAAWGGVWPAQLESGVMFYEGERITRAEFEGKQ